MATDVVQIVNMALARIQDLGFITDLDDDSPQAVVARTYYETDRDEVLSAYDWGFARQEAALSVRSDVTTIEGVYVYTQPDDLLVMRSIWTGIRDGQMPGLVAPQDYLANPGGGRPFIVSDLVDAQLTYTRRVTEVPQYPPHFVNALAWRLAQDLAMALTSEAGPRFDRARTMYAVTLEEAKVHDQRQFRDYEPQSDMLAARDGPTPRFPPWSR